MATKFKIGDEITTTSDRPILGKIIKISPDRVGDLLYRCELLPTKITWSFYDYEIKLSDNQIFNESFEKYLK